MAKSKTSIATPWLCLASASARRRELLEQIAVPFIQLQTSVDETCLTSELPEDYVRRLALEKAQAGWRHRENSQSLPALGADTAVVCDGQILGKPASRAGAVAMLELLSGRTHQVYTGVALADGERQSWHVVVSQVQFMLLSQAMIEDYCATEEPMDKAGSYAIQGRGGLFVRHLQGSYSAVVGLPLYETGQLLQEFGLPL